MFLFPSVRIRKAQEEDGLHQIADAAAPEIERLWDDAFRATLASIAQTELTGALMAGNEALLTRLVIDAWQAQEDSLWAILPRILGNVTAQAGVQTAQTMRLEIGVEFRATTPHGLTAIDRVVANEIREIGVNTRYAIREMIRRGFNEFQTPAQLSRNIRQIIGLTQGQWKTVLRYRDGLRQAGMSQARIVERTERFAQRQIRRRARVIARHETMHAVNLGQDLAWTQAVQDGVLDPQRLRRYWLIGRDDRTCPTCRAILAANTDGVAWDAAFQWPGGIVRVPPAHVQCRCTVRLRVSREAVA